MYEKLTRQFSTTKTISMGLVPREATITNIERNGIIEEAKDVIRSQEICEGIVDRAIKEYLNATLSKLKMHPEADITKFKEAYYSGQKKEQFAAAMELRNIISDILKNEGAYKSLFKGASAFRQTAEANAETDEEKDAVALYGPFASNSDKYATNREQLFDNFNNPNAVATRLTDDNLPIFLDNAIKYKSYIEAGVPLESKLSALLASIEFDDFKTLYSDHYFFFSTADEISMYNTIIGGIGKEEGVVPGVNMIVNEWNQKLPAGEKKLPLLKPLKKQLMFEGKSFSFKVNKIESDEQLHVILKELTAAVDPLLLGNNGLLVSHLKNIDEYSLRKIFIDSRKITDISMSLTENWQTVTNCLYAEFDELNPKKAAKQNDKYFDERRKYANSEDYYSIDRLNTLVRNYDTTDGSVRFESFFQKLVFHRTDIVKAYSEARTIAEPIINDTYTSKRELIRDDTAKKRINALISSMKELADVCLFFVSAREEMDVDFYAPLLENEETLKSVTNAYTLLRNYLTRKPYETVKMPLYFGSSETLRGWDSDHIDVRLASILKSGDEFYLCILNRNNSHFFDRISVAEGEPVYQQVQYKQLAQASKNFPRVFISSKKLESYGITCPDSIKEIYNARAFKEGKAGYSKENLTVIIDYFKSAMNAHPSYSFFGFEGKPSADYVDIDEFYADVEARCYKVSFATVPKAAIDEAEASGQLYMFRIFSRDMKETCSPNKRNSLFTMYFKELFAERNISIPVPVYKLNGEASVYFREKSLNLDNAFVHKANEPIPMRHPLPDRNTSVYPFDIIKYRRFMYDHFELHMCITCNFGLPKETESFIDDIVDNELRTSKRGVNVLGIKRGETNLLYACVVDPEGNILYQKSLNEFATANGGTVNYADILDKRDADIIEAKSTWSTIGSAADLRKGYLSVAIGEIVKIAEEYDAMIAIEDLTSDFKDSRRIRIAKNIYYTFEEALLKKLSFCVLKDREAGKPGSLQNALQLADIKDIRKGRTKKTGIVLLVSSAYTENLDITTGYVPHIRTASGTIKAARDYISKFDEITYDNEHDCIRFVYDYRNFGNRDYGPKTKWTLYAKGVRSIERKNPVSGTKKIELCEMRDEFSELFKDYGIRIKSETLKDDMLAVAKAPFFDELIKLINTLQQMKNYKDSDSFISSPVCNDKGEFFNTLSHRPGLPECADANGAYNIARRGQQMVDIIRENEDYDKLLFVKNSDWLTYAFNSIR